MLFSDQATSPAPNAAMVKSEATTAVPSQNVSRTDLAKEAGTLPAVDAQSVSLSSSHQEPGTMAEKEKPAVIAQDSRPVSSFGLERKIEKTAIEEAEALERPTEDDDEIIYPSGVKLFIIMLALTLSVFLVALDNTIIATAIPRITDHFKAINDVGWYGSSYLLTTCAFQLLFGKGWYSSRLAHLQQGYR